MKIATFFRKPLARRVMLPLILLALPFSLFAKDEASYNVDDYTGWAYKKDSSFSVSEGKLKLSVKQGTGSFCIYAINEKGSEIPLLSAYDSFSSNHFGVRIGKHEYNLNRESGVVCQSRRTPYGAQLSYTIKKQGIVVIDFTFMPSDSSSTVADVLRVSAYLVNLGKKKQTFSLKGMFDTVLGEPSGNHFMTATSDQIDKEVQFDSMNEEKWICSTNGETSVQFLLKGKGINPTHEVTLSNKDTLSKNSWVPSVKTSRSFNSVLSYNNSALCVNWPEIQLEKNDSKVITFYISVGTDSEAPAGDEFLSALEEGRTVLHECEPKDFSDLFAGVEEEKKVKKPRKDALGAKWWVGMPNIASYYEEEEEDEEGLDADGYAEASKTSAENASLESAKATKDSKAAKEAKAAQNAKSSSNSSSKSKAKDEPIVITEEQLDTKYIHNLINYIKSLENDSELIDQEELNRLNKELDAILEKIRSMN
ncbi:MAG: hypothetical protein II110_03100 [Treponema sp.]|nr:hypothetical protein [Treponema sp.]